MEAQTSRGPFLACVLAEEVAVAVVVAAAAAVAASAVVAVVAAAAVAVADDGAVQTSWSHLHCTVSSAFRQAKTHTTLQWIETLSLLEVLQSASSSCQDAKPLPSCDKNV